MTKKEIIRNLKYTMEKHKNDRVDTFGTNISLMCKDILDYLEQEPCGKDINVPATDCISRQEAINSLGECPINWTDSDGEVTAERDWKDTVEMLKSLPSVIPTQKWIPVSEELPKEDGEYLVTSGSGLKIISFANDLYKVDEYDFWDKKGVSGWFDYDSEYGYIETDGVIAWVPLPQPYKIESEE